MILLQLLFLSFLPPALWIAYCVFSGYIPLLSAFRGLFFGFASVLIVAVLQWALDPVTQRLSGLPLTLFSAFLEAALIEETVKLTMLNSLPEIRRGGFTGRPLLAFAVLVGLSFSSFENLMYSLQNPSILLIRYVTALPVHVGATVIAGAALLRFRSGRPLYACAGIFSAGVILHGAFNLFLGFRGLAVYGSFLSILILVGVSLVLWYRAGHD